MGLAANLTRLRGDRPRESVAKQLGVSERHLRGLENGGGTPSFKFLFKLADFYSVAPADLLRDDTPSQPAHGVVLNGRITNDGIVESSYALASMGQKRGSGMLFRGPKPVEVTFGDRMPLPGAKPGWWGMRWEGERADIPHNNLVVMPGDLLVFAPEREPRLNSVVVAIEHRPKPWHGPPLERPSGKSRLRLWKPQSDGGPPLLYKIRPTDTIDEYDPEHWTVAGVLAGFWRAIEGEEREIAG